MEEIKSGKEVCDAFFEGLIVREDIDPRIVNLLYQLYKNDNLKKEKIIQGLQNLRQNNVNEQ